MNKETWKAIAIIFLVLLIIETIGIVYVMVAGTDNALKKHDCLTSCSDKGHEAFYYEESINTCYCYKDGVIKESFEIGEKK